jgi:3-mercaptopyruvate sulfurtransferase SseA
MQDTQYSPSIISTDELEAILNEPNVKILDCSVQTGRDDCSRMNFLRNHIKNAIYADLDNLRDKK